MKKFEVGKQYTHGWIGDSELFTTWTVIKRTAKTITIQHCKEVKTCRVIQKLSEWEDAECLFPYGNHSMCPTLRATQEN